MEFVIIVLNNIKREKRRITVNIKKISLLVLVILLVITSFIIIGKGKKNDEQETYEKNAKYKVVASNFASYDFLRAIIGDNKDVELKFLLGPGKEAHSYEPTAQDLIEIQDSNLFVYVGGEMEKWSDKVIDTLDKEKINIICISDFVEKIAEKEVDGAEEHEDEDEHEHENGAFDEHIWTSPKNAIKMVEILENAMEKIDEKNSTIYKENADKYIAQIREVDSKIQSIVDNRVRDRLIFADKMPMQYFIDYYKLKVSAAFDGCSTEVDPSAKTIAYLQQKVEEEKIPVILYIELNNGKVANIIANETKTKAMQIQTLHNVSLDDFENGETWVSLMTRNLEVLKEALQ